VLGAQGVSVTTMIPSGGVVLRAREDEAAVDRGPGRSGG
jgi:hypothetical protein